MNIRRKDLGRCFVLTINQKKNSYDAYLRYKIMDQWFTNYIFYDNVPEIFENRRLVFLDLIHVTRPYQGLGTLLITHLIKKVTADYIILNSVPTLDKYLDKKQLINFYKKFGANILEQHDNGALMYIKL